MSLRDKMLAVMADVNSAVSEREELVELIAIALLTEEPVYPGRSRSGKELRDQCFPQPHHRREAI